MCPPFDEISRDEEIRRFAIWETKKDVGLMVKVASTGEGADGCMEGVRTTQGQLQLAGNELELLDILVP
jgi:hypothetical protein